MSQQDTISGQQNYPWSETGHNQKPVKIILFLKKVRHRDVDQPQVRWVVVQLGLQHLVVEDSRQRGLQREFKEVDISQWGKNKKKI